ncbi:MAG: hypothetical protein GXP44_00825 [bacterium]|nr:hypothetical protein [bacterium]
MEKKYVVLDKEIGETPLALMDRFRAENPWVGDKKLTYAGRLDPMASGKMIVLIGEECKNKEKYLALDKEYEFEVLFGFSTDTGDVLGLVESEAVDVIGEDSLKTATRKFVGEISLPYPAFSSKTVQGKPLFAWALEGRLDEIEIPRRKSVIYKLSLEGSRTISKENLHSEIFGKIAKVGPAPSGGREDFLGKDFRKQEILDKWEAALNKTNKKEFQIAKFVCACSSGTYMRTLAVEIGKCLGVKSLAFSIHRTKIGENRGI